MEDQTQCQNGLHFLKIRSCIDLNPKNSQLYHQAQKHHHKDQIDDCLTFWRFHHIQIYKQNLELSNQIKLFKKK